MDDMFWSTAVAPSRMLCVSPLSRETILESDINSLGNDTGYFIYEVDEAAPAAGILVLGKAASEEAAMHLVDLLQAARQLERPYESAVSPQMEAYHSVQALRSA